MKTCFGNPSSSHITGIQAKHLLESTGKTSRAKSTLFLAEKREAVEKNKKGNIRLKFMNGSSFLKVNYKLKHPK